MALNQAPKGTSRSFKGVGAFLFFGSAMATLAGITLAFPGTALDAAWKLNPQAYEQMSPLGPWLGVAFLSLATLLVAAAVGWLKHRYWGWLLTVTIIATQVVGDFVNILHGDYLRGVTGFVIASALLAYLLRPSTRQIFTAPKTSID
jgi:hypothetical protein